MCSWCAYCSLFLLFLFVTFLPSHFLTQVTCWFLPRHSWRSAFSPHKGWWAPMDRWWWLVILTSPYSALMQLKKATFYAWMIYGLKPSNVHDDIEILLSPWYCKNKDAVPYTAAYGAHTPNPMMTHPESANHWRVCHVSVTVCTYVTYWCSGFYYSTTFLHSFITDLYVFPVLLIFFGGIFGYKISYHEKHYRAKMDATQGCTIYQKFIVIAIWTCATYCTYRGELLDLQWIISNASSVHAVCEQMNATSVNATTYGDASGWSSWFVTLSKCTE